MSITVSNPKEIHDSPLNLSMSKQLYSFSKGSRFDKLENVSYCSQAFYDTNPNHSSRSPGIGYGKKYDIGKGNTVTPAPNKYSIKGEIDTSLEKKKGYQFGVSRDKMEQQSILGAINKFAPGPGKYDSYSTLSNVRYSIRQKNDGGVLVSKMQNPGPGQYNAIPALTEKGDHFISKFKSSGASVINPISKRFQDDYTSSVPGPNKYNLNMGIQADGKHYISSLQSSQCRSFPHQQRDTTGFLSKLKSPGPGQYKLPSEFGHYESARRFPSLETLPK